MALSMPAVCIGQVSENTCRVAESALQKNINEDSGCSFEHPGHCTSRALLHIRAKEAYRVSDKAFYSKK